VAGAATLAFVRPGANQFSFNVAVSRPEVRCSVHTNLLDWVSIKTHTAPFNIPHNSADVLASFSGCLAPEVLLRNGFETVGCPISDRVQMLLHASFYQ